MQCQLFQSLFVLTLASTALAQSSIREFASTTDGALLGGAIADAGDLDGDGWNELAIGEPGYSGGIGRVRIVRGSYVRFGAGSAYLALPVGTGPTGMGASLLCGLDFTGDGTKDIVAGGPGWTTNDGGWLFLIKGENLSVAQPLLGGSQGNRMGWSLASPGDINFDGRPELLAGAPYADMNGIDSGRALLISGNYIAGLGGTIAYWDFAGSQAGEMLGWSCAANANFDSDPRRDFVFGCPGADALFTPGAGAVRVYSSSQPSQVMWSAYGSGPGAQLGFSVDTGADLDNDAKPDVLAGMPTYDGVGTDSGRVRAYSGDAIGGGASSAVLFTIDGTSSGLRFGASVAIAGDLNKDGELDLLVGAPDYDIPLISFKRGAVYVFSGESHDRIGFFAGDDDDEFGAKVARSLEDYDGDTAFDFIAAGASSNASATDGGIVHVLSLFPALPASYCTAKTNSLGCVPSVAYTGSASVSSSAPFLVRCNNVLNNKNGLLFYGFASNDAPFQGGVLCVRQPTVRTVLQSSGGSANGTDCTGTFSFDFNAHLDSGVDANLVFGQEVRAQYWSRDPGSASTTSLSNALRFIVNP